MNGADVIFAVAMLGAGAMTLVVVWFAVKGAPGVVSLSPPPGSPRWPVYGFFAPWFIAGFAGRAGDGDARFWLYVRLVLFLVVLVAFVISWRRAKANPPLPPRI